jgi:L-threonylcarbamoyladenylate synthase
VSPTTAKHVVDGLGDVVDVVVDGGPCPVGIESTVVSVLDGRVRLLRPGMIDRSRLEEVVDLAPEEHTGDEPQRSPGLARKHYAPRARVVFGEGPPVGRVGRIVRTGAGGELTVVLPDEPEGFAAGLYAALRELDGKGVDVIAVQPVPEGPAWEAIRDRLVRAQG